jgi:hypothetical protein
MVRLSRETGCVCDPLVGVAAEPEFSLFFAERCGRIDAQCTQSR